MALRFVPEKAAYDETADGVRFFALCSGPLAFNNQQGVRCLVTRDAVSFIARNRALDRDQCLEVFREYRNLIETTTRTKYLERPVDSVGEVWLAGSDIMS
jgi:hypothetical protein